MSDQYEERWRLSKSVPISIIFFLAIQTIAIVGWAFRLDYRVQVLENMQPIQDHRLDNLEQIATKLAVIDDRQITLQRRVEIQTTKLDQLLGLLTQKPENK